MGTLLVSATFVALAAAFVGLGLGVERAFVGARRHPHELFTPFWVGFAAVIVFLMLWHFVFPVNAMALGTVLTVGLGALAVTRPRLPHVRTDVLITGVLFSLWVAYRCTAEMRSFDSSLYHMQGVKWAREFALVPGLVNLFGPMGFNNASFLYDAMLDHGPFLGRAWHVCNGLFVIAAGLQALAYAAPLVNARRRWSRVRLFWLILLPAVVHYAVNRSVSSFSTVEPAALLAMVTAASAAQWLVAAPRDAGRRAYAVVVLVVLSTVTVAIKTSASVFAACVVASALAAPGVFTAPWRRRAQAWTIASVVLIGAPWAVSAVVLSGYVLFPSTALSVPVEWRAPEEHARAEMAYIVEGARGTAWAPAAVGQPGWAWLWVKSSLADLYDGALPLAVFGVAVVGLAWRSSRGEGAPAAGRGRWWWLAAGLAAQVVGWWLAAPMVRYAAAYFWALAAWAGAEWLAGWRWGHVFRRPLAAAWGAVVVSPLLVYPAWEAFRAYQGTQAIAYIVRDNVIHPSPGDWFQRMAPTGSTLEPFTTNSGLVVNVPAGNPFARCWDAPLPCTSSPAPNLRLRDATRMDRGFVIDGAWQMQGWPDPWTLHLLPILRKQWESARR